MYALPTPGRTGSAKTVARPSLVVVAVCGLGLPLAFVPMPAQAATSVAGVVNTYQAVSAISGTAVTTTGGITGAAGSFRAGDRVLVVQMTGANPSIGSNFGNYETTTVATVSGSTVTLTSPLVRGYSPTSEKVQLVKLITDPGTTTPSGTITALPWNGSTGGVVAMAGGTLNLNAKTIDVVGDGFSNTSPAYGRLVPGNTVQAGSTSGRGAGGVSISNGGGGGGGLGGGGGTGGNGSVNAGGSIGAGTNPSSAATGFGTNGGQGAPGALGNSSAGGSGGGGGVIGGGGGGGGGDLAVPGSGGGGGVGGGGGGGHGSLLGTLRAGAGGGGVGSTGNGGDGLTGGLLTNYGSAGGGGGSYGGGGASGGIQGPTSTGGGGGGGGSWTGGGAGGYGNGLSLGSRGGAGNGAVTSSLPDSAHYLNRADPRLMMGGAGGRGSSDSGSTAGGRGGGIVFLAYTTITGGGSVVADGADGVPPSSGVHSGSGGGAGGQVKVTGTTTGLSISADGGDGGKPSSWILGSGAGGGGGGGGGVWLEQVGAPKACGAGSAVAGVTTRAAGGIAPRLNNATVGGGAGGTGLVCSTPVTTYALGDRVWRDSNADGIQSAGEPGLAGVSVSLLDGTGATLATATSSASGRYVFDRVPAGTYRVKFGLPSQCAYAATGTDGARVDNDSDAVPLTGTTAPVVLGDGAPGVRPVVAGDGTLTSPQINPTVDAGLVCSTTSATTLGAFNRAPLSDLQVAATGPFDGATGTVVMSATSASSSFVFQVDGIDPSVAGTTYGAHLHFGPCVAGDSAAAGAHYNTDVLDGNLPPETSPRTEVWLDLTPDANGYASAHATVPFVPSAAERSIVVHAMETNPDTGTAGARQACLPIVIR